MSDTASSAPAPDQPAAVVAYHSGLHEAAARVLEESGRHGEGHRPTHAYAFIQDLEAWLNALEGRRESILLVTACREYQFGLHSAATGLYRHAFSSLRLFLELTVAALYYSAHELLLREWLGGRRDNNWRRMTRSSAGVFGERFTREFCEPLLPEAPHYGTIAANLYRECSEFVHGNIIATGKIPVSLQFSPSTFDLWHTQAESARLVASFFLFVRYSGEMSVKAKSELEGAVLDQLGHLNAVRAYYESATVTE